MRQNASSDTPPPLRPHSGDRATSLQAKPAARGLSAYERQRRWEAAQREARVGISPLELVSGRAVGGDKKGEALVEDLTHGLARGVEERGRRPLHPLGTRPGMLSQDLRRAERVGSRLPPGRGGFLLDLLGHGPDALPVGLRRQMLPAGKRREGHGLGGGVLERIGVLSPPAAGGVLLGAVEPGAGERLAVHDLANAVEPRPLPETGHQVLFDPMAQDVLQSRNLRLLLAADQDRLVAPLPDLARPAGEPGHLPRQIRVEVAGEFGQPLRALHEEEGVVMIRDRLEGHELDRIEPLGPAEDARGDVVELRAGPEQQAPVQGPAGDLDQGAEGCQQKR